MTTTIILGGGIAGVTAAFELTATEQLRRENDVVLMTPGWRLGGKCASGRNAAYGQRIEEHGLHVFFGFYDNAFNVLRRALDELDRPPSVPVRSVEDAFRPFDDLILWDRPGATWKAHRFPAPPNKRVPGVDDSVTLDDLLDEALPDLPGRLTRERSMFVRLAAWLLGRIAGEDLSGLDQALVRLERLDKPLWRGLRWLMRVDQVRLAVTTLDLVGAAVRGIHADRLLERGFSAVDDQEFTDWLRGHGAHELTLRGRWDGSSDAMGVGGNPLLRSMYDTAFAYEDGDPAKPSVAAGKALAALIRITFAYKGHVMWKPTAGMGDVVFAPLYEVLRQRGVDIRFFTAATDLGVQDVDGAPIVTSVDFVEQVWMANGPYEPLIDIDGLPCWPSVPLWTQLKDGPSLEQRGIDFEHNVNPLGRPTATLRLGEDFDKVVLAIPPPASEPITRQVGRHSPGFAEMLAHMKTVSTQAYQLWLTATTVDMGFRYGPETLSGAGEEPLDTYADMSHQLSAEHWTSDPPQSIAYLCGVIKDVDGETQAAADARARANLSAYLQASGPVLWPDATDHADNFDWSFLHDPAGGQGRDRLSSQYARANRFGSERYVLTPPGSTQFRLAADGSGIDNLYLAGDWTDNGIDGGSAEAAFTSGRLASRAICGAPSEIFGEHTIFAR